MYFHRIFTLSVKNRGFTEIMTYPVKLYDSILSWMAWLRSHLYSYALGSLVYDEFPLAYCLFIVYSADTFWIYKEGCYTYRSWAYCCWHWLEKWIGGI